MDSVLHIINVDKKSSTVTLTGGKKLSCKMFLNMLKTHVFTSDIQPYRINFACGL